MTRSTVKRNILRVLLPLLFWLAVWYLAAAKIGQELILPSPVSALKTFIRLCGEKNFWLSAAYSLGRIMAGLVSGIVIGTVLGAVTSLSGALDALFSPILRMVRSTPVASFIILMLLWVGRGTVPGFISALMVIPVVCGNVQQAVRDADKGLLEMAKAYKLSTGRKLRLIYAPSVLPSWSAACVTSVGLAWKAGIAAEVLCQPKTAIGAELYYSKLNLETPALFAWTALVVILSYALENLLVRLIKGRADV